MIHTLFENLKSIKTRTISLQSLFFILIFILPIILYLSLVIRYSINVPFWDEWGALDLYKSLRAGSLTLKTLWIPHNEHRSILFLILYLAIVWFSKFNTITPLYFALAFKFISLFLIVDLLRITLRKHITVFLLIALFSAIFIFAAQEGELVFWGEASLLFNMSSCFTILLFWGLVRYPEKFSGVLIAFLAAIGGSLVSANGLFLWGLGVLYLLFHNLIQKKKLLSAHLYYWLIVMTIFLAIYFYDYHAVNTGATLSWILSHKKTSLLYFLAYMSSLTTYGSDNRAILFGGVGLLLLGVNLVYYLLKRDFDLLYELMPWFLFPLYVLLVALVTTAGRAQYGVWQAQSARYVLFSYPFWFSLFVLSAVLLESLAHKFLLTQVTKNILCRGIPVMLFILPISIAYAGAFTKLVPYWHYRFSVGLQAIYEYPYASEEALTYIYPDPAVLYPYIRYLDENNLGPFAPGYRPQKDLSAHSIPLLNGQDYFLDLSDRTIWSYDKIRVIPDIKDSWEIKSTKPSFTASTLPTPICINDFSYLYAEMAASGTLPAPSEMQIFLISAPRENKTWNQYLITVPFVTGSNLNAYSVDLQSYNFPQNAQIVSIVIYPLGQEVQQPIQAKTVLTIHKLGFVGNGTASTCNK